MDEHGPFIDDLAAKPKAKAGPFIDDLAAKPKAKAVSISGGSLNGWFIMEKMDDI